MPKYCHIVLYRYRMKSNEHIKEIYFVGYFNENTINIRRNPQMLSFYYGLFIDAFVCHILTIDVPQMVCPLDYYFMYTVM